VKLQLTFALIAITFCTPALAQDAPPLTVTSTLEYQVFQRSTRLHGTTFLRGSAPEAKRVEARVEGTSIEGLLPGRWQRLALDRDKKQFSGQLPVIAGGFHTVEVKATNTTGQPMFLTVPNVGVGEVFVISGQSNSTNYGEVPQMTQTGMVMSFNGTQWSLANDPQLGVQDNSQNDAGLKAHGHLWAEKVSQYLDTTLR